MLKLISISKIKDYIYIGTIIIAIGGFLVNEGKNRQKQEEVAKRLEKIEELMQEQLTLNGKIIMYMELDTPPK